MGAGKSNSDLMNIVKSISGLKFCSILIFLIPLNVLSHADTLNLLPDADTSSNPGPDGSPHSLFTGIGSGSNMIYFGSTISGNQPFSYTSIIYGFNYEFFATVSTIHLSEKNPYFAFYTGSLNYNHVFNSWLDLSSGIYRYQVAPSLADTLFSNFTYGDLTLGIDWRLIYSKLSVDGLLSGETSGYLQIKNSRYFKTPAFFMKKAYISFDPYVNLLLGTLIKEETNTGSSVRISPPYRNWKKNHRGASNTTSSKTFGIMETDFGLPVDLNFDRITIEAEASYVFPVYKNTEFPLSKGFIFLLSGTFRIF